MSGLLESASVLVNPTAANTGTSAGQSFNHHHQIDFPTSGPFDLAPVSTSTTSAIGDHSHTFNLSSQTKTFPGNSTHFRQSGDVSFPLNPRDTVALKNLGRVLSDSGDYPAAIRTYEMLLESQPGLAHQLLAEAHLGNGSPAEAARHLAAAEESGRKIPAALRARVDAAQQ